MFSCSSQCNVLVLIKANKGKHSLMRGKRKMCWSPGEPDSSLFASSHNKSHGSFNGWMAVPCVNVSLSWLQRSSRWTALLLLAAMVPNSMPRRHTSIACVAIQYQFGSWKEFVIATWAHAILFLFSFFFPTISGLNQIECTQPKNPACDASGGLTALEKCSLNVCVGRGPFYSERRTAQHFICIAIFLRWDDFGGMTKQGCHA